MEVVIRENINQYMEDLKRWLKETEDVSLETMETFFDNRVDGYEERMSVWGLAYKRFAQLLPAGCRRVLDLGCGTGLELEEIYRLWPDIQVTGVDMCRTMLDKLVEKYGNQKVEIVCRDYFRYDMGSRVWDAVISFESLHHFFPEKKIQLYKKIYDGLENGKMFILGDYIACCPEEEEILRNTYLEKRRKSQIHQEQFVHFDIPLTLEHEIDLLQKAGFSGVTVADVIQGATLICSRK